MGLLPPSPLSPQQKEQETLKLKQEVEMLQAQKRELLTPPSRGENSVAGLKDKLWKLESSALEHQQIRSQQENTIQQLEQVGELSLADPKAQGVVKMRRGYLSQLLPSFCGSPLPQRTSKAVGLTLRPS